MVLSGRSHSQMKLVPASENLFLNNSKVANLHCKLTMAIDEASKSVFGVFGVFSCNVRG